MYEIQAGSRRYQNHKYFDAHIRLYLENTGVEILKHC
jgi:hypothetical protein